MKYKIEKNTVQETLMIPLYGRKMCSELYPRLYRDETAIRLMDEVDYDFSALEKKSGSKYGRAGLYRSIGSIMEAEQAAGQNANKQLVLENLFLELNAQAS
mgnify:CR=1 FL=1